jgi:hypothetical protein
MSATAVVGAPIERMRLRRVRGTPRYRPVRHVTRRPHSPHNKTRPQANGPCRDVNLFPVHFSKSLKMKLIFVHFLQCLKQISNYVDFQQLLALRLISKEWNDFICGHDPKTQARGPLWNRCRLFYEAKSGNVKNRYEIHR